MRSPITCSTAGKDSRYWRSRALNAPPLYSRGLCRDAAVFRVIVFTPPTVGGRVRVKTAADAAMVAASARVFVRRLAGSDGCCARPNQPIGQPRSARLTPRDFAYTSAPAPAISRPTTVNSIVPAAPVSGSSVMFLTFSTVTVDVLPSETKFSES